ncbi:MAG: GNAT family N-acetyltransferase [Vulcanimicrobiota bacterium]
MVRVRRIEAHEWEQLRDIRLSALKQAPEAFCSTLAEATRLTSPIWEERARMGAESERTATFVVDQSGRFHGMTVVTLDQGRAEITAVFLEPEMQGQGLATQMLRQALDFAGPVPVWLEVNQQLVGAEALYARCGFRLDGGQRKFADGRVMRSWVRHP